MRKIMAHEFFVISNFKNIKVSQAFFPSHAYSTAPHLKRIISKTERAMKMNKMNRKKVNTKIDRKSESPEIRKNHMECG